HESRVYRRKLVYIATSEHKPDKHEEAPNDVAKILGDASRTTKDSSSPIEPYGTRSSERRDLGHCPKQMGLLAKESFTYSILFQDLLGA
ncbi:unnamed protein product, partial [Citrullus colocynthis]